MAGDTVTLRLHGSGSLTFEDASGRKRVLRGEAFTTDRATAELLLRDGGVTVVQSFADVDAVQSEAPSALSGYATLRHRAAGLGVTAKGKREDLEAAVAAAEAHRAALDVLSTASDPVLHDVALSQVGAVAGDGGGDHTRAEPETGPITLGDLSSGGKVK